MQDADRPLELFVLRFWNYHGRTHFFHHIQPLVQRVPECGTRDKTSVDKVNGTYPAQIILSEHHYPIKTVSLLGLS